MYCWNQVQHEQKFKAEKENKNKASTIKYPFYHLMCCVSTFVTQIWNSNYLKFLTFCLYFQFMHFPNSLGKYFSTKHVIFPHFLKEKLLRLFVNVTAWPATQNIPQWRAISSFEHTNIFQLYRFPIWLYSNAKLKVTVLTALQITFEDGINKY